MTTPVGSIRLDLLIDGSKADEQIRQAFVEHLGPALERTQKQYEKTGQAAEKSTAKQKTATKAATEAVEDLGDEHLHTARKAETSTRAQTRSVNAVTRAVEKQALAIEKATAAQIAYNAAIKAQPTPNDRVPPRTSGGGSGGGGGGGSRGGRGGGFLGFGGPVTGAVGWNSIALGVGSFPAAATAVVNLTGAIQQLGQAGLLLPGIFAGIGSSVGTAVIGFQGMGDAITTLGKAMKDGASAKDLQKAAEAMDSLAPSAQNVAKAVATNVIPAFEKLKKDVVQQNMFEGIDQTINDLTAKTMPTLTKGLGGIATAWNTTFKQLGVTLGSDSSQGLLDKIFGNTAEAQTRLSKAIDPLVHAFGTLTAEGTDFLPRIADGFGAVMTRFDNWITKSVGNGNLDKWINQGIDAASHLGESFLNVGKIITSLTKAAGGDGGFLKWLDDASGKLATFLNSDAGQAKLTAFFEEGKEQLRQWGPILGNVAQIFGDVYSSMKDWSGALLPILQSVSGVLIEYPGLIQAVTTAFLAWKTIDGVTSLFDKLTSVSTLFKVGLPAAATAGAAGISAALGPLAAAMAPVAALINWEVGLAEKGDRVQRKPGEDTLAYLERMRTQGDLPKLDFPVPEKPSADLGQIFSDTPAPAPPDPRKIQGPMPVPAPGGLFAPGNSPGATLAPLPPGVTVAPGDLNGLLGNIPAAIPSIAPLDMPDKISIPVETPGADQAAATVGDLSQTLLGLPGQKAVEVSVPGAETALSKLQGIASALASIQSKTVTVGINQTVSGSSTGGLGGLGGRITGRATGGPIWGGIPGLDSVPVLAMPGEHMLTTSEVNAGGGHSGIYRLRAMLRAGWFKGMETGGAVDGTPPSFGLSPLATDIAAGLRAAIQPMLGLLAQIRDNIGGRGGGYGPSTTDTVLASSTTQATGAGAVGPLGGSAGDYKSYPLGDPRRIMAGVMSGIGMPADEIGAALGAAGGPLGDLAGDVVGNIATTPLPGPLGYPGTPTNPSTDLNKLIQERNPLAFAQAAGFDVPDYSRYGGDKGAIMANGGPAVDASGRMFSDTAALVDRTFTNLDAAEKARHDQTMTVLNEVKDRLGADPLKKVVTDGVSSGMDGMANATTEAIGTSLGAAAGPPIAAAVASAAPTSSGGAPAAAPAITGPLPGPDPGAAAPPAMFHSFGFDTGFHSLPTGFGPLGGLYDEGGLWPTGTFGTNLSGRPERVLDPDQTRLFDAGLLGGWNLQPWQQHMATVKGVDVTDQVGGDFFGVSQVPILGALVNLLVMVLLRVIGVQIEARDTLNEISSQFREFRGDFQAFDAGGRLMNDTSGLVDRTGSSEQAAADERIRILKLVLEGLIKFIIEKIIVPIGKAVANTAIQAGAQVANGAITGGLTAALPAGGSVIGGMVGSVVSSAITAGGSAAVDIIADVGTKLGEAALGVLIDGAGEILQGVFPDITKFLFGGGLMNAIATPVTNVLTGMLGGLTSVFGAVVGGLADLWPFDNGGVANGIGFMPKATIQPERVLDPRQTNAFEQMVRNNFVMGGGRGDVNIHMPTQIYEADKHTGQQVHDKILDLLKVA